MSDSFDYYEHQDSSVQVQVTLTTTPFTVLAQENNLHPGAHHITSIVGGNHKDCFELFFSILFVLKFSKFTNHEGVECFGGKFSELKSLTFLFPAEYSGRHHQERYVTFIIYTHI
jgi:hypothetical protein